MTVRRDRAARLLAALLAALLLGLCSCASEEGTISLAETTPEPTVPPPTLEPLPEREGLPAVRVYCDGLLEDRGYLRDETVFLDPGLLCEALGLGIENSADEERFSLKIGELQVSGEAGTGYFLAGERYLYAPEGWLTEDGRAFLSTEALSRIFRIRILCAEDPLRAEITTAGASVMNGSGLYYLEQLSNEEFYWLLHVIAAEAGNQPLAGQLGVGNVVMNRVKNEEFPDTVKQVVFQQGDDRAIFTPVENGDIHMVSDDLSLIAAYLVLEGYNNVGESLYFVNPTVGNSSWVTANRTFVVRIGDHDFYA